MIKCIVIDDEPPAVGILENYISKVEYLKHLQSFTDPVQALSFLNREPTDLIFLDINMPNLQGIDLVKTLNQKPLIVFTTAYPDYAVEGFALDVLDYLVKPIPFQRFLQTTQRAYDQLLSEKDTPPENNTEGAAYIFVKSGTKVHKVHLKDIYSIEGLREYVSIKTAQQKLITLTRLSEMEEALKDKGFVRIHKSHIINLDQIESIEFNHVKVGNDTIPIGEKYKAGFEAIIKQKLI